MKERFDLLAVGEILIDFTPGGKNADGAELFARNPGGAPANVLAMHAKLGGRTAFIGKVGADGFGSFLRTVIEGQGIDAAGLAVDPEIPTTLAFVHLDEKGDRSFSFCRKPGADIMLRAEEIPDEHISVCEVFHFGSVSLTDEPARSAVLGAAQRARDMGKLVSFDPNYRPALWKREEDAVVEMLAGTKLCHILKVSGEEMTLLTGTSDLHAGAEKLLGFGPKLVLVSLGADGAYFKTKNACGRLRAYDVHTVDTTGAGDAFLGAILYRLRGKTGDGLDAMSADELFDIVSYGNAAGSLTTTKGGAIPALPTHEEIEQCRAETKTL